LLPEALRQLTAKLLLLLLTADLPRGSVRQDLQVAIGLRRSLRIGPKVFEHRQLFIVNCDLLLRFRFSYSFFRVVLA
jgi:hypothetical protein